LKRCRFSAALRIRQIRVARIHISDYFTQAAFLGGGIQYADKLLKSPQAPAAFFAEQIATRHTENFSGLECRWDEVKNDRREGRSIGAICMLPRPIQKLLVISPF